jgi:uncharacterized protein
MPENPENIKCRLCGSEFVDSIKACPRCGVDTVILIQDVHMPPPRGPVNDYPGILTDQQSSELTGMLEGFIKETDIPVVIAIVQTTSPLAPPEYAFMLYNHWGIGQAGVDRGFLILLCLDERHVESEVGFGLEDVLPEDIGDEIVQKEFVLYFMHEDYFGGLKAGTSAVMNAIKQRLPDL